MEIIYNLKRPPNFSGGLFQTRKARIATCLLLSSSADQHHNPSRRRWVTNSLFAHTLRSTQIPLPSGPADKSTLAHSMAANPCDLFVAFRGTLLLICPRNRFFSASEARFCAGTGGIPDPEPAVPAFPTLCCARRAISYGNRLLVFDCKYAIRRICPGPNGIVEMS